MTQQQCDCASHGKMNARDKFLHWLLPKFFDYRDIIVGGELYLRRYYLKGRGTKSQWFLHNIRLADPGRELHDHPWPFKTFILLGSYVEEMPKAIWGDGSPVDDDSLAGMTMFGGVTRFLKTLSAGDSNGVPATHIHRIFAVHPETCWTLVHAGAAERTWGFWVKGRFIPWRDYLPDSSNAADLPEDRVAN